MNKMAQLIKLPLGVVGQVRPGHYVLDRVPISSHSKGQFVGGGMSV